MARGKNPIPGSSSCSCHCALTLLFPYTLGPGHTGRSHTITLSIQREAYTYLSSTTLPFPTAHSCPSSRSTTQSVCPLSPWLSQSPCLRIIRQHPLIHTHTCSPLLPICLSSHPLSSHSFPDAVIHLSIHQPITHLPTFLCIHLPTCPPTHLFIYPSTYLHTHGPTYPWNPPTNHSPTHGPTYPRIHLPIYPPTHGPTYLVCTCVPQYAWRSEENLGSWFSFSTMRFWGSNTGCQAWQL